MAEIPRAMPADQYVDEAALAALPEIGVGLIGYGFMGKAHSAAYHRFPAIFWPPPARVRLVAIAGRTEPAVTEAARRYGFERHYTDWRDLVAEPAVTLVDNVTGQRTHAAPSITALQAGKHVVCEKPLAVDAAGARQMRDAARAAEARGVKHIVGFNYRFAPAVRLARDLIAADELGRVHRVHLSYLQDHQSDPQRLVPAKWGGGTIGALLLLGSHTIDLARFLVGEVASASGQLTAVHPRRPAPDGAGRRIDVEHDETTHAQLVFRDGALGSMEVSFVAPGRKNQLRLEVNGTQGSLVWDLEDLNRLRVFRRGREKVAGISGFEDVLVTQPDHALLQHWWPPGHILGWESLHANLIYHLLRCIAAGEPIGPDGATFEDGYRAAVISDAIVESSRTGRRVDVRY